VPSRLLSLSSTSCCGRRPEDAYAEQRDPLLQPLTLMAVTHGEGDRQWVTSSGEGSGRGVIGPQRTVAPTNDNFAVASSAVVTPENIAPSKQVLPENLNHFAGQDVAVREVVLAMGQVAQVQRTRQ
jgi:hypothetical protein